LLTAAKQLLRDQGYARITARDLVAASGTNLASIGYHFGSKEALLNEAIGESFTEWNDRILAAAMSEADESPLGRLMNAWRVMLDDFEAARPIFVAFIEALAQAERSPELRAQLAAQYDALRRDIGASVAEVIGGSDGDVLASFMIAVGDGLLIQSFLDPERAPGSEELEGALARGLAAALAQ
jgi:AcrR family transcriptional regulator